MIWPLRKNPKSRNRTVSSLGSEAWVLVRRRNSSLIRSSALVVRSAFHCEDGKAVKVKSSSPASSKLTLTALQRSFHLRRKPTCACSTASRLGGVDHPPIILGEFLAQMRRRLGQQIPQLMISAALNRELGPLHLERRGQSRIAINHRQHGDAKIAGAEGAHRFEPGLLTLAPGQPQIEHHTLAVGAYAQCDQHRHPHALFPDPHPRIPAVEKQVTNLQLAEIPFGPGFEVFAQAPDQARHRILRQRRATQQRRKRSAQPTLISNPNSLVGGQQR